MKIERLYSPCNVNFESCWRKKLYVFLKKNYGSFAKIPTQRKRLMKNIDEVCMIKVMPKVIKQCISFFLLCCLSWMTFTYFARNDYLNIFPKQRLLSKSANTMRSDRNRGPHILCNIDSKNYQGMYIVVFDFF